MTLTKEHFHIIDYLKDGSTIYPALVGGDLYKGRRFGSETTRRCRELRKMKWLASGRDGKYVFFWLIKKIKKETGAPDHTLKPGFLAGAGEKKKANAI